MVVWYYTAVQAVKDSARLLLSQTIGNRLSSVINQLGSSTCYRYTICDSKSIPHTTASRPRRPMKTYIRGGGGGGSVAHWLEHRLMMQ